MTRIARTMLGVPLLQFSLAGLKWTHIRRDSLGRWVTVGTFTSPITDFQRDSDAPEVCDDDRR